MSLTEAQRAERRVLIHRRIDANLRSLERWRAEQEVEEEVVDVVDTFDGDELAEVDLGASPTAPVRVAPRIRRAEAKRRRCSKCSREGCRADRCTALPSSLPEPEVEVAPPATEMPSILDEIP